MSFAQSLGQLLSGLFGGNQSGFGIPLSNRNYIVDGNMDSSISSSLAVAAGQSTNNVSPMYYGVAGATNGGTMAISAAPWALGSEPLGMTSPVANVLTWTQAAAATTAPSFSQRIENVQTLQGRSATFSCWLWCASTQTITNLQLLQNFGTGGSPSANVVTNVPVNWVLTTTPQRFSVLVNVPSIFGKQLGTNASTHYVQPYVQLPVGTTYAINTAQWQLEQSSPNSPAAGLPTAFEYRGFEAELARVQRYYYAPTRQQIPGMICTSTTSISGGFLPFPVTMRATPVASYSSGSFQVQPGGTSVSSFSLTATPDGFQLSAVSSGLTIGWCYQMVGGLGLSADARL
jgi:hypothetical protein